MHISLPMGSAMKNNKLLTWLLTVVLLGVWGSIVYQLVSDTNGKRDFRTDDKDLFMPAPNDTQRFTYTADVRDPFQLIPPTQKKAAVKKEAVIQPQLWVPPPFRLTGIVENNKKKTAILEGNDGTSYFLVAGDSVSGVKIVKIEKEKVEYDYANQEKEWVLER